MEVVGRIELDEILNLEELLQQQKSRSKWLRCRDRNTRYFHSQTSARQRGNRIKALLLEDGSSCFNPDVLRDLAVVFYSKLYQENFVSPKPFQVRNCFPQLSIHEISALTADISLEEVLHALFGMDQLKAPRVEVRGVGPLKQWFVGNEPIKEDMYVVNMVNQYGEWSRQRLEACHPGNIV
ncbi:hypothetical protein J1N35_036751 [Gossypium stocksii]|uniref:Uncharacterized protein n=1 Tax=Gossypium stocksii TaxID=47602 RepID=A0A9D3UIT1_9ROSI|nr:hypothetical protein J1N35_036751 [Gossypium stocksii]